MLATSSRHTIESTCGCTAFLVPRGKSNKLLLMSMPGFSTPLGGGGGGGELGPVGAIYVGVAGAVKWPNHT